MKKTILIIASVAISTISFAQTSLKVYNQFSVKHINKMTIKDTSGNKTFEANVIKSDFIHPTVAIQWTNKQNKTNFHQLEITDFQVSKDDNQSFEYVKDTTHILGANKVNHTKFGITYEYNMQLFADKRKKNIFYLGLGINPYYSKEKTFLNYNLSADYYQSKYGFSSRLTPHYIHKLSKKLFAELYIPITLFEANFSSTDLLYTGISNTNRTKPETFNFNAFPRTFAVQIGVGINL